MAPSLLRRGAQVLLLFFFFCHFSSHCLQDHSLPRLMRPLVNTSVQTDHKEKGSMIVFNSVLTFHENEKSFIIVVSIPNTIPVTLRFFCPLFIYNNRFPLIPQVVHPIIRFLLPFTTFT